MKKLLFFLTCCLFVVACSSQQKVSNYQKATQATKDANYEQAIELFTLALNEENSLEMKSRILYDIGFCYGILKDYEKEVDYYKQAVEVDFNNQAGLYDLGKYYYENKDFEEAIKMYSKLVEVNPEHEGAYYMLGLSQYELGNKDQAIENMKKAADLNSEQAVDFLKNLEK